MDPKPIKVLLIEDHTEYALVLEQVLTSVRSQPFEVERAEDLASSYAFLDAGKIDVILLDLNLGDSQGLGTLAKVQERAPNIPVVVLTGGFDDESEALALRALKQGAEDYLIKARVDYQLLIRSIRYAIERKQKQREIRSAEAQTEQLLGAIPSIMIGIGPDDRVTHWNAAAEAVFGIPKADVIHRPFSRCPVSCDFDFLQSSIDECRRTNRPVRLDDFAFKRPEGQDGFLGMTVNPVRGEAGERTSILILGADITERKKAQEEKQQMEEHFRQVQKMESLGTLAGGIAHDFKNILGPILGYTEMMKRSFAPDSKEVERLDKVLKCVRRAQDLVNQIVAFSRKGEEKRRTIQPTDVVREVLTMLKEVIPSTVEISSELDPDSGVIFADPTQLHQVVMNLCTNANYAMRRKGGRLHVAVQSVQVEEGFARPHGNLKPGPHVKFVISDTGTGIDSKVLPRIFDPFFTTKPVGEGSGMGLAAVYGIVKRHGGVILVSSEIDKGTTFEIYFPKISGTAGPEKREDTEPPHGTERILLVDDRPEVLEMIKDVLESLGYRVETKTSSLEALELFRVSPGAFDLVITDQTMPKMTGTQLAAEINRLRVDIPVVLCTGSVAFADFKGTKDPGIQEYLEKPISMADLAHAVRRALSGPVPRRPSARAPGSSNRKN